MNPSEPSPVTSPDTLPIVLSRIRVVLSHPAHPGNIGAAARALKTMGLSRLHLVQPKDFYSVETRALASGALDVLRAARVFDTLDDALEGTTLAVAMSARERDLSHPPMDVRTAAREVARAARHEEIALVFGNETAGLANDEVMKCNRLAYIPASPDYTSLNLAQAVQVTAYEVRMAACSEYSEGEKGAAIPEYSSHEEVERFYVQLESSIYASGFLHPRYPRRIMERLRRLFSRARLEKEEINILRGMLSAWDAKNSERK